MRPSSATLKIAMQLLKSRGQPEFDMSKTLAEVRKSPNSSLVDKFHFYSYASSYWQDHILYVSGQDAAIIELSTKLIRSPAAELSIVSKDCFVSYERVEGIRNKVILTLLLETGKIDANTKIKEDQTLLIWAA
jgi:hypothetical protein